MSESNKVQCDKCLKYFSKQKLSFHWSKCVPKEDLVCKFCNAQLASKRNLENHLLVCKASTTFDECQILKQTLKETEERYQTMLREKEEKYQSLLKEKDLEIKKLNSHYLKVTSGLENDLKDFKATFAHKEQAWKEKEFLYRENLSFHQNKSCITNNNNNSNTNSHNTVINNNNNININQIMLKVEPINHEEILKVVDSLLNDSGKYIENEENLAKNMVELYFFDKVMKCDPSRKVLTYNENNKTIKDTKGEILTNMFYNITQPLFESKKQEISSYLMSNPNSYDHLTNAHQLCIRVCKKDEKSKKKFRKNVTSMAKVKDEFSQILSEKPALSPFASLVQEKCNAKISFFGFINGVEGFGYELTAWFEDLWLIPYEGDLETMLFRVSKADEYKPLSMDEVMSSIMPLLTDSLYLQLIDNLTSHEGDLIVVQNNEEVKLPRKVAKQQLFQTFYTLKEKNLQAWQKVYDILLCK